MSLPSVTFETKCYEKDWEILLKTGRLEAMIERNQFDFGERILYINNVADPDKVRRYAERCKEQGIITEHVLVDDYADEALAFFGLDRDSFKGGYYYSIQELVGIYRCRTEYLLHFSSDSVLDGAFPWIERAVERLQSDRQVRVVNCLWNRKTDEAVQESHSEDKDFWVGSGFSDQSYLIRASDFRNRIYGETHPASQRYPVYGGELFEKRVDAWMRNNGFQRCTYKHGSYLSKNFPRNKFLRTAGRLLGFYDR
ncbi:MAG: hypothetical protein H7Y05_09470 [Steroidobacteraceae bacterium]|nr:hypothetical protein [Deltaproteobacteria bacterium]